MILINSVAFILIPLKFEVLRLLDVYPGKKSVIVTNIPVCHIKGKRVKDQSLILTHLKPIPLFQ